MDLDSTMQQFGKAELFVFSLVAGFAVYYLVFRRKKTEAVPGLTQADLDKLLQKKSPVSTANVVRDANFVAKMKRTSKNIVIFHGSQTGTAEEFAVRLANSAPKLGMKGLAADPEDVDDWEVLTEVPQIERSLVVFCLATYGEGEPTDNATELHNWLKETTKDAVDLTGLKYAVFALGNRTYEHYNEMGIFADKQLEKLGAERICPLGLGDDDQNIEDDFVQWQDNTFWPAVCSTFGVQSTGEFSSVRQYELKVIDPEDAKDRRVFKGEPARFESLIKQRPPFEAKNPFLASISTSRKLNAGDDRYLFHLELDITGSKMRYDAGDHVAVLPTNQSDSITRLSARLPQPFDLDTIMSLDNLDPDETKKHPFPCPCTFRTALGHYLDISTPPTTHFCRELAEYASDDKDKEFLMLISSNTSEGKEKYSEWVKNARRSVVEILEDLPSVSIPADHLCELLPRLQVRYYSISSSAKVHSTSVHVTGVLVEYDSLAGRHVTGVATKYLLDRCQGAKEAQEQGQEPPKNVPCYIRKSQFRLPLKTSVPIIMIGPGTGFAPFRGFLQEKAWQKEQGKPIGDVVLFFGARTEKNDYIYKDEVESWVSSGVVSHLFTAWSRDQEQKIYVQQRVQENAELIWSLLTKGAHIYICGDAKNMARDVYATLEDAISKYGEMSKEEATQYLKNMSNKGRYSADVWS